MPRSSSSSSLVFTVLLFSVALSEAQALSQAMATNLNATAAEQAASQQSNGSLKAVSKEVTVTADTQEKAVALPEYILGRMSIENNTVLETTTTTRQDGAKMIVSSNETANKVTDSVTPTVKSRSMIVFPKDDDSDEERYKDYKLYEAKMNATSPPTNNVSTAAEQPLLMANGTLIMPSNVTVVNGTAYDSQGRILDIDIINRGLFDVASKCPEGMRFIQGKCHMGA